MKKWLILLLVLGTQTVQALDTPKGSNFDGRIQKVNYNDEDVVLIRASITLGTQLVFAQDENILDIASGFSQGWELEPRRNVLYIKPKAIKEGETVFNPEIKTWDTNLHVATNKRLYKPLKPLRKMILSMGSTM